MYQLEQWQSFCGHEAIRDENKAKEGRILESMAMALLIKLRTTSPDFLLCELANDLTV